MVENLLADGGTAYQVGSTIGAILWPVAGAVMLSIGILHLAALAIGAGMSS